MKNITSRSFRDPAGFVIEQNDRILRFIYQNEISGFQNLLNSPSITEFVDQQIIVSSKFLSKEEMSHLLKNHHFFNQTEESSIGGTIEHERINFPSYPYEWPPEMLHRAGLLTLDLAEKLLQDGLGLKDASPYNVLFKGTKPVFIDVLSFEKRNLKNPIWLPYAQFVRNFLLPLLANKFFQIPLSQIFTTRRDGLGEDDIYYMAKGFNRFRPIFLSLVIIPKILSNLISRSRNELVIYNERLLKREEQAKFVLKMTFNSLRRKLEKLIPSQNLKSQWNLYMTLEKSYTDEQFLQKHALIDSMIAQLNPKDVLDIGCNTGTFSVIASKRGCRVVSIDFDPVVIGRLYQKAAKESLDILPLVIDFGRPSPGTGWLNRENPSFLDRATGRFDLVLMLAVIHHLLIQERIPMNEIASILARITRKYLIIEYISPQDPMFSRIARGRDHLYIDLTQEFFEKIFGQYFKVLNIQKVGDAHRTIYLMEKK